MASDIKLNDSSVILEGKVGIGTSNPEGNLHIVGSGPITIENPNGESDITFKSGNLQSWQVGMNNKGWYVWDNDYRLLVRPSGETHSGGAGAGFSFADRTKGDAEGWVWYAQNGEARLWSQRDTTDILRVIPGQVGAEDPLVFINEIHANDAQFGTIKAVSDAIRCRAKRLTLSNPRAAQSDLAFNIALAHTEDNQLVINQSEGYKKGVKIEGNVQVTGVLTQASSIALKENVAELSTQEAMQTLQGLNAVKYNYKADEQKQQHIGFIAEEVPDLVANSERDRLSPMDIVAVLTKAVQEQQKTIMELAMEIKALKH